MKSERPVVIVGLGPGPEEAASQQALKAVRGRSSVYVTAPGHPAARLVREPLMLPPDVGGDPATVAGFLAKEASGGEHPVIFAVPGSPFVAEPIVSRLLATSANDIQVIPGASFLDTLWGRLGVEPFDSGIRLMPADRVGADTLTDGHPAIITDLTPVSVDGLSALAEKKPTLEVVVAHHVGLPDESLLQVPLTALNQVGELDSSTSLYLPKAATCGSTLVEALRAQERGTRMGYGMPDLDAAFADVEAEVLEARQEPTESEIGDILFAAVQVSRLLNVAPDHALRQAVRRFIGRLDYIEGLGENLAAFSSEQLRQLWNEAKRYRD